MRKLLAILLLTASLATAAQYDLRYLQENSTGKIVERTITLTPSTFLSVNGSGQMQVQSSSAFRAALGLTTSDLSDFTTASQTVGDARYPQLSASYSNPAWITALAWSKLTGTPTTLSGYGITDGQPLDSDLTAISALETTSFGRSVLTQADAAAARSLLALGTLATQNGTFSGTTSGTNTGDQTITLTGAVTGTGTGTFATTLAADQARANLTGGSGALNLSLYTLTLPTTLSATNIAASGNSTVNGNFTAGDAAGDEFVTNDDDPRFPNLTAATYTAAADGTVAINGNVGDYKYATGAPVVNLIASRRIYPTGSWTTVSSGSGASVTQTAFSITCIPGLIAGNYAIAHVPVSYFLYSTNSSYFDAYAAASGLLFVGDFYPGRVGQAMRFLWGGSTSDATSGTFGTLNASGIAVEINSQSSDTAHYLRLLTWEADTTVASSWVSIGNNSVRALWLYYNRSGTSFTASVYDVTGSTPTLLVTRSGTIDDTPSASRGIQIVSANDGTPGSQGFVEVQQVVLTKNLIP